MRAIEQDEAGVRLHCRVGPDRVSFEGDYASAETGATYRVRLIGDTLRISVTDGGSADSRPHTIHAASSALSGRGMAIVEAIVDEWWTEQARSSSTIHTRLSLD